jgi:hypothetical protein
VLLAILRKLVGLKKEQFPDGQELFFMRVGSMLKENLSAFQGWVVPLIEKSNEEMKPIRIKTSPNLPN